MKLAIIIPTFNEALNIGRLLGRFQKPPLRKLEARIVVVDDSSPDKTAVLVKAYARKYKNIHLLLRQKKAGLGSAYLAGMKYAFERLGAEIAVIMDADLSHDPVYIPDLLGAINKDGADLVIGSRYIKGGAVASGWAPHRKFLSVFGNKVVSQVLGKKGISDWTSGYRAIKRRVYQAVYSEIARDKTLRGYTFNVSLVYHAIVLGFTVREVPIKFIDRTLGKSKLGFEYLIHTPVFILKTRLGEVLGSILKP